MGYTDRNNNHQPLLPYGISGINEHTYKAHYENKSELLPFYNVFFSSERNFYLNCILVIILFDIFVSEIFAVF